MIESLNRDQGIPGRLRFERGPGELVSAVLDHAESHCRVALHGAQVLSWVPSGGEEVLFLSRSAHLDGRRSIRGGIPICWPWFGDRKDREGTPQHGFARTTTFEVVESFENEDSVGIELGFENHDRPRADWPHPVSLRARVWVGRDLEIELETRNPGSAPFTLGAALHSYFRVGDAERLSIGGLAGTDYLDKVRDFARTTPHGPPQIRGEIDRVYLDTTSSCQLDDPVLGRRIEVGKTGSRTTVLWNPGPEKAAAMEDFDDAGFREMVCVEAVNAFEDCREIAPGESHVLSTRLSVSALR